MTTNTRNFVLGMAGGCALVAAWALSVIAIAVLTVVGPGLLFGFMLAAGCKDLQGPLVTSPDRDGGYVAQVRSSDRGAVGWNTRVVVSRQTMFVLDEHPQQIELALGSVRPQDVNLEWTAETTLLITSKWSSSAAGNLKLVEWQGVEIHVGYSSYRE